MASSPQQEQQVREAYWGETSRLTWIIVILWFTRFAASHRDEQDYRRGRMMPNAEIVGHDDDPLTYDDVAREFARVPAVDEPTRPTQT